MRMLRMRDRARLFPKLEQRRLWQEQVWHAPHPHRKSSEPLAHHSSNQPQQPRCSRVSARGQQRRRSKANRKGVRPILRNQAGVSRPAQRPRCAPISQRIVSQSTSASRPSLPRFDPDAQASTNRMLDLRTMSAFLLQATSGSKCPRARHPTDRFNVNEQWNAWLARDTNRWRPQGFPAATRVAARSTIAAPHTIESAPFGAFFDVPLSLDLHTQLDVLLHTACAPY